MSNPNPAEFVRYWHVPEFQDTVNGFNSEAIKTGLVERFVQLHQGLMDTVLDRGLVMPEQAIQYMQVAESDKPFVPKMHVGIDNLSVAIRKAVPETGASLEPLGDIHTSAEFLPSYKRGSIIRLRPYDGLIGLYDPNGALDTLVPPFSKDDLAMTLRFAQKLQKVRQQSR